MLMRYVLLKLCRTRAELRLMWTLFYQYRALTMAEREVFRIKDKRIHRSLRLCLLWAIFKNVIDTPVLVLIGLLSAGGLLMHGISLIAGQIGRWVH